MLCVGVSVEIVIPVKTGRQYLYKIEKAVVTLNIVTISTLAIALEILPKEFFDIEV